MTKAEQESRREHWRRVVAEFEASGLSQRAFWESRGLSRSTFQKWVRRFRCGQPAGGQLQVLEVQVVDDAPQAGGELEVMLAGAHSLWFPVGTDPRYVAALAVAFEEARRC